MGDAVADDCDDGDPWVYVGAFEFCDGYDNDCDGTVDEGPADEEEGACAFLPKRTEDVAIPAEKGCNAVPAPMGLAVTLLGLGLAFARRRERVER
jgi:uncharacterized protein (TIGR03382 family)